MVKLKCKRCNDWKVLSFRKYCYEQGGITVALDCCPLLECPTCGIIELPDKTQEMMNKFLYDRKDMGLSVFQIKGHTDEVFDELEYPSGVVDFKYHKADCWFIPALCLGNLGDFTPVFFNIEVLVNYIHNPKYNIELGANTFGHISSDEFSIAFGINRSGKVIMWLIDILKLPEEEQYYLRSKNIDSDHDVGSEFYEAQFECIWAEPSRENSLIGFKSILARIIAGKYGFDLYFLNREADDINRAWTRPVLYSDKEVGESFETINKLLVESMNPKGLKSFLKANSEYTKKGLSDLRSMKLFRLFLVEETSLTVEQIDNILAPLFVLYDLRIVYAHLASNSSKEEKFTSICLRLQLPDTCRDNETIYNTMINQLLDMLKKIIFNIEDAN